MLVVGISTSVMAITLVVLASFMIPAFIEIRKTAISLRETLNNLQRDIKPVMNGLQETLGDLKILTEEASGKIDDVGLFMEELGNAGRTIRTLNNVIGGVTSLLAKSSLWATGAKVAGKVVIQKMLNKRG